MTTARDRPLRRSPVDVDVGDDPSTEWYDLHAHTRFSDGSAMDSMAAAALEAGCDGIGFADHCLLVDDDCGRRDRYDLVETYDRRRERIDDLRDRIDLTIFDAVEFTYVPGTEAEIRSFLEEAAFDYAIGSVHLVDGYDVTSVANFTGLSAADRDAIVDAYYETVCQLVESELFEIVGHVDLPERIEPLRGRTTEDHYRSVADALASSSTIPELNAGRALRGLCRVQPAPSALETFTEKGIEFVLGTDGHAPAEIHDRFGLLVELVRERSDVRVVEPAALSSDR